MLLDATPRQPPAALPDAFAAADILLDLFSHY